MEIESSRWSPPPSRSEWGYQEKSEDEENLDFDDESFLKEEEESGQSDDEDKEEDEQ